MTIDAADKLAIDLKAAERYSEAYLRKLNNSINDRGLMIGTAIQEFNTFCSLPEKSSKLGAIWDVAFAALSLAVPALGLAGALAKAQQNAALAVAAAKNFGNVARKTDKVVKVVADGALKGGSAAETIDKAKDLYTKSSDLVGKINSDSEVSEHASFEAVVQLVAERSQLSTLYDTSMEAIYAEWILRLDENPRTPENLEAMARRLLPSIDVPETKDDFRDVKRCLLYAMLVAYCKAGNVYWEEMSGWLYLKGLNESQFVQINRWFGPATIGKFFKTPIYYVPHFLEVLNLNRVEIEVDRDYPVPIVSNWGERPSKRGHFGLDGTRSGGFSRPSQRGGGLFV